MDFRTLTCDELNEISSELTSAHVSTGTQ